jgi:hypothetical protein
LAVGDRVICRRNDALIDVDNGTRGTVRHLDLDRVVIGTDSHLIRELPAAYVAEHVEHAYALTGHGMQGATVDAAIVIASPRDLTAGWSYTALSRARTNTRLLLHDEQPLRDHVDIAPEPARRAAGRDELLAQAERRMREPDAEDLAIEQLVPAGRADDPKLARARDHAREPAQEHAAIRAEPPVADASSARLRELKERIDTLDAQRAALPRSELHELDSAQARLIALTQQHADLTTALDQLAPPKRSLLGRLRDPALVDRTRLTSALHGTSQQIDHIHETEAALRARLGDPEQIRSELDGRDRAITALRHERNQILDTLTDRELENPSDWARHLLGERPTGTRGDDWDQALRRVTRYRLDHDITDTTNPLGPEPHGQDHAYQWQHAHETLDRAPGRDHELEHDLGL